MRFLRTNTAARVTVGPFFDKTDGVTPKTSLTVTACKLTFLCDVANVPTLILDTNPTASGGANDMVHVTGDDAGFYDLELAAADVNYLGRAMLALTDAATHCPVFHEFMILPAVVYDAMVLGTDLFDVSVTQLNGVAASAQNLEKSASVMYRGSVTGAATTTTLIDSGLTQSGADHWKGRIVIFTSGTLTYQASDITAFDPSTDKITFTALTAAPSGADAYVIV
jgi:hypothetical protein